MMMTFDRMIEILNRNIDAQEKMILDNRELRQAIFYHGRGIIVLAFIVILLSAHAILS